MELVSVAAVADNGVIGRDDEIPWDLPEDVEQYRTRVAGAPVILGRPTFEALASNQPGSAQIVMSRTEREYDVETAHHAGSVEEATNVARSLGADTAYVLGGAGIFRLFQPHVDRMVLTRVPGEYEGDAYYPDWDPDAWTLVERTPYDGFTVEEWVRDPTG